jgi:hypothetical protein
MGNATKPAPILHLNNWECLSSCLESSQDCWFELKKFKHTLPWHQLSNLALGFSVFYGSPLCGAQ